MIEIIPVREHPETRDAAIAYFQRSWPDVLPVLYQDSITHCIDAANPLPQWYLLLKDGTTIGCAGLITNDFISRGELYPWLCALFIEESQRGKGYPKYLFDRIRKDAHAFGFPKLYLCTEHNSYYERYGFRFIGNGYHPWGEASRIYEIGT